MNYFMTSLLLSESNNGLRDDRYTDWRTNLGTCATVVQQLATTSTGGIGADGDKYMITILKDLMLPGTICSRVTSACTGDHNSNKCRRIYEGRMINTQCVARICRALTFGRLTDCTEVFLTQKQYRVLMVSSSRTMTSRRISISTCLMNSMKHVPHSMHRCRLCSI